MTSVPSPVPEEPAGPSITISVKEYLRLRRDSDWLEYLQIAGVDNWCGFQDAVAEAEENGFFDDPE
jgi:hypothetical protein